MTFSIFIAIFVLTACTHEKPTLIVQSSAKILPVSHNSLRLIEYDRGDTNDTKIGISPTHFLLLNYGVGHADFHASSAEWILFENGKVHSKGFGEVDEMEAEFNRTSDSLQLKKIELRDLVSRKNDSLTSVELKKFGISQSNLRRDPTRGVSASRHQVKKEGELLLHLSHSKSGLTKLSILKNGQLSTNTLCEELKVNSPCMTLMDITNDGKKELFVFYPEIDYWDSESYGLDIFNLSEFY